MAVTKISFYLHFVAKNPTLASLYACCSSPEPSALDSEYFDISHNSNGRAVSSLRLPHFTPKEIFLVIILVKRLCGPLGY
jgi:hypothetical protein